MPSRHLGPLALAVSLSVAAGTLAVSTVPSVAATALPALMITEINVDSSNRPTATGASTDAWEFVEVHNTTDAAISLDDGGYTVVYRSGSTEKVLSLEPDSSVPAGGALVLWAKNSGFRDGTAEGGADARLTKDDFTAFYAGLGVTEDFRVAVLSGQDGLNNSGTTMWIRRTEAGTTTDVAQVSWVGTDKGVDATVEYAAPADATAVQPVLARLQPPNPGTVRPEQLGEPPVDPEPETGVPTQGPPPPTDPALRAPVLQVTEVAPDTANVGGADAYEFVEVYNSSDAPVNFRDFTLNYLYIDANAVVTNEALWPATPSDPVIEPGQTLVLWVKNAANASLTAADFNAAFDAHLTAGEDLVEVATSGMSNGGLRGIQVMTNTGLDTSRTYYFNDAQTTATTAIQYAWNPAASPDHLWVPEPRNGTVQTMTALAVPTPGYAAPEQVPGGLVATPATTTPPTIDDLTGGPLLPETEDLVLGFDVRDDHQVRTARLTIASNVGDPVTRSLRFESPDRFVYQIPAVDLYGKQWIDYTLEVSDGTHTTTLGPVRIELAEDDPAPVRLNRTDGELVSGETWLTATTDDDPAGLGMTIDGQPVADVRPSLEAPPMFAFEATNTDAFFRNGVKVDDEVLTIFDEGFYARIQTVATEVPVEKVVRGQELTVGIYAGTKAWPEPDLNENNDDFAAMTPRLALPDGRVLSPIRCAGAGEGQAETERPCPAPGDRIAFADASQVYFTATFDIPDDAFDSVAHLWDTTAAGDGDHTVVATAGEQSATRTLVVDNTAPQISTGLVDGDTMRGAFTIDAEASDAGSGVETLTAELDGTAIELPHPTSSVDLDAGEHVVELVAVDRLGNTSTREVRFTTPEEQPSTDLVTPSDGASVPAGEVTLQATPSDPEDDVLDVSLRRGFRRDSAEGVRAWRGTTYDTSRVERDGAVLLTAEELASIATTDGLGTETSSADLFPYQLFTVDVPADAGDDFTARVHWKGSANADARVVLHVLDTDSDSWDEVAEHLTTGGAPTGFVLEAMVPAAGHVADGEMTVLVQHSEGFTTPGQSERGAAVAPYSDQGVTPRGAYDFTVAWESDTQYYNQNPDFYPHQQAIHRFLLEQRSNLDLQYLAHTGDIVNDWDQQAQWERADAAYQTLDDAGLPYGVLAGNHDVGQHRNDYGPYGQYFGDARFAANPWFGGSHRNNRGHYDLISADGIDLMVVSMGWGAGDEQIDWLNEVIAAHPERKVMLNLHEFMLTTGGLGPIPQRIMDEVVKTNPNVFAVGSGHYHDAYTRTDEIDDTGDGVADRTVYSMLFDYQGLPEGGLGYLRLLHFDNVGGRIVVRTYSPSLDDFDSDDPSLDPVHQEFEIPYAASGMKAVTKRLSTDEFHVDLLTTEEIATFADVASGTPLEAAWNVGAGEHGWYAVTSDPYGAVDHSAVHSFTATPATEPPTETPTGTPTAQPTPGPFVTGTPAVTGRPRVGKELVAEPGTWSPGTTLAYAWLADGEVVAGATGRTLSVGPDLVRTQITVRVTGSLAGHPDAVRDSPATQRVRRGSLDRARPSVRGVLAVGKRLTAKAKGWTPGTRFTFVWFADGKRIGTGARLVLRPQHRGDRIAVRVTGRLEGYEPVRRWSKPRSPVRGR